MNTITKIVDIISTAGALIYLCLCPVVTGGLKIRQCLIMA